MAITDHGTTSGWYLYEKAARKAGINPVFGVEAYWVPDVTHKKDGEFGLSPSHLVLLAKNEKGIRSINEIQTASNTERAFYGKARCDNSILRNHSEGVVALSACLAGAVGKYLKSNQVHKAREWIKEMYDIFGDNFYLELQPHNMDEQRELNRFLYTMRGTDIKFVVTTDSHYPYPKDWETRLISYSLSVGKRLEEVLDDTSDRRYPYEHTYHVKGYQELYEDLWNHHSGVLPDEFIADAMRNTHRLTHELKVELPKGMSLMPLWKGNAKKDLYDRLQKGYEQKILNRGGVWNDEYVERLRYEYELIVTKGFSEYFLVVSDMVEAAKEMGIMVGVGRGSAGGSLVSYLLDITEVDPIRWNLPLERFLSPHRGGFEMSFHGPTEITKLHKKYIREVLND